MSRSFQRVKKLTKVLKVSGKHPCESRGEETGIGAADLGANRKVGAPSAPSQLRFSTNSLGEASLPTGDFVSPEAAFQQAPVYYMCATVRQDIHTCLSWTARPMLWGFACCRESGPHRWCSASVHSRLKTKAPYCHSPVHSPSSHVVPATLAYLCSGIWAAIEGECDRYNKENPLSLSSPGFPGM